MGCASSKPVEEVPKKTTAAEHHESRTKEGSQRLGLELGPDYKLIQHLGEFFERCNANRRLRTLVCLATLSAPLRPSLSAGRGGTGDTWAFKHIPSGEDVAVKFIKRPIPKVLLPSITREFVVRPLAPTFFKPAPRLPPCRPPLSAHCSLFIAFSTQPLSAFLPAQIQAELGFGHQNVIKAYEAILTRTHLCLVMEYAAGGSLTAYVADKWQKAQAAGLYLSEDEALFFFTQFLSAVHYCHDHSVAHRDLKLDNTLLDTTDPPIIKICDFGFAKTWSEEANMFTQIGTPVYMSPEVINSKAGQRGYDGRSVDVWASGILLLVMLLGSFPFDHTEHPDPNTSEAHLEVWLQQVSKRWSEVPHMAEAIKKLSPECKDLLNRIFVVDAKKRITLEEIEHHPWYKKQLPESYATVLASLHRSQDELDAYTQHRIENKAALEKRTRALEELVMEAGGLPEAGDSRDFKKIDLRPDAVAA
jgi:serine/threonine-protein kinase SRK2